LLIWLLLTTMIRRVGSIATLPQSIPPIYPGQVIVGRSRPIGVNVPSNRAARNMMRQISWSKGVNPHMRASVGRGPAKSGRAGEKGWVDASRSPGAPSVGTLRSTIGNNGRPVRRSSTNIWPRFVGCTSAGVPRISISTGCEPTS
jgi:hypothetical protein